MSIAMTEIMLSDLPHIKYKNKDTYTKDEEQMLLDLSRNQQNKIKKGGLAAAGIRINLNGDVRDGNALLNELKKH